MNRDLIDHLIQARHHLGAAALSLVPARLRRHVEVSDRELRALIIACLTDPPTSPPAQQSRRITVEE